MPGLGGILSGQHGGLRWGGAEVPRCGQALHEAQLTCLFQACVLSSGWARVTCHF